MRAVKKKQIGPRVQREVHEALERLAAVNGCSLAYYCESVLADHIARQQHPEAGGGALQELVHELDNRFAAHARHQEATNSRELSAAVLRLEKHLNALKAMVDALIQTLAPDSHDAYVKTVKATFQKMGLTADAASNGAKP